MGQGGDGWINKSKNSLGCCINHSDKTLNMKKIFLMHSD